MADCRGMRRPPLFRYPPESPLGRFFDELIRARILIAGDDALDMRDVAVVTAAFVAQAELQGLDEWLYADVDALAGSLPRPLHERIEFWFEAVGMLIQSTLVDGLDREIALAQVAAIERVAPPHEALCRVYAAARTALHTITIAHHLAN